MKKVLIGLFALASVSAFANEGINVYGKFGLDFTSKFTNNSEWLTSKTKKIAPNFTIEVTKDVTSNLELGAGIGYTIRKGKKVSTSYEEDRDQYEVHTEYITYKSPAYNSIPLYLTAKYNFDLNSSIKPYLKADLGYSFNRMKKNHRIDGKVYSTDNATNKVTLVEEETGSENLKGKVTNGLYAAVGVGAEYNNFLVDLSYVHTNAKIKGNFNPVFL